MVTTLKRLTVPQAEVFQLIVSLGNQHRYPSLERLGNIIGIKRASVNNRIDGLIKKGYVIKDEYGGPVVTVDGINQYMKDLPLNRFKK